MILLEKVKILTPLQKLPKNVWDLGKIIVAKGFKKLHKVQKIAQSGHTAYHRTLTTVGEGSTYGWSSVEVDWIRPNKKTSCYLYLLNLQISNESNWWPTMQWYFPLLWVLSGTAYGQLRWRSYRRQLAENQFLSFNVVTNEENSHSYYKRKRL